MSRRRVSDEALARWFSFEPATQPLGADAAPEPPAGILQTGRQPQRIASAPGLP
jgi:hypothetical protein